MESIRTTSVNEKNQMKRLRNRRVGELLPLETPNTELREEKDISERSLLTV